MGECEAAKARRGGRFPPSAQRPVHGGYPQPDPSVTRIIESDGHVILLKSGNSVGLSRIHCADGTHGWAISGKREGIVTSLGLTNEAMMALTALIIHFDGRGLLPEIDTDEFVDSASLREPRGSGR